MREHDTARRPAARRAGDAGRPDRAAAAAGAPGGRGRQRRADERHPDARQPRLDRARRDDGRRAPTAAAASSPPACSSSPPSASSSSRSTGSGSSATQQVTGSRTEYLRYLGNIRKVAREAADQQRRALNWHHPEPAALPSLAEEPYPPVGAHRHRRQLPARALRPVLAAAVARAGAAGERARRPGRPGRAPRPCTGCSSSTGSSPTCRRRIDLRAFDRIELCGEPRTRSARLARAMICSATAFHNPDHLVVAVLTLRAEPHPLGLGQVAAARPERPRGRRRRPDAAGLHLARRPRGTCCPPDLSDRPRFGADERAGDARTSCS